MGGKAWGGFGLLRGLLPLTWLGGLWLVPLGNIQVLACNRYLPGGLLGCSLRRDWAARRLLGSSAGMQGLEAFPWLLSPPLGLPPCPPPRSLGLLGAPLVLDSHQPWAFGGFNPCVFGGVSPFSLLFSRPLPLAAPLSMSVTTPTPFPNSLAKTAAPRDRALRQTLPPSRDLPSTVSAA